MRLVPNPPVRRHQRAGRANLDGLSLDAAGIEAIVRDGRGGMPSFGGDLSDAEISAVASFVAESR